MAVEREKKKRFARQDTNETILQPTDPESEAGGLSRVNEVV